ncbi:tyrosine-type recombinase/integrase [Brevundimonas faecalis]|uniref:Integrase n=1 Tax=Brevundimonas faecalis TaxID=947378 RepID=A0ABV2RAW1_9CAUL
MPRPSKGPRLFLRKARPEKRQASVWVIRDGAKEVGTGCGPGEVAEAGLRLAEYIQAKWTPAPATGTNGPTDPTDVLIADVLSLYADGKAAKAPDPKAVRARLSALLEFWGESTVADVRRSTCEQYVAHRILQPIKMAKDPKTARRVTDQGARRELEDLSAAIGYWHDEHPLTRRPKVVLPQKAETRRDALTRSEAARLLLAAMGWYRNAEGKWKRRGLSARLNRAHIKRFILIGLYTGTRPGVIPKLLWSESAKQAWVDIDDGVIYRRGRLERDHRTKRRPLVVVPNRLLAHLRRWRDLDLAASAELREAHLKAGGDPLAAPQIVSVMHHGARPIAGRIRTGFEGVVRDAGLSQDVTPHWMRHTCATWLMQRDAKLWEASGFTGMTVKTLEECYGHHRPSNRDWARKAHG